MGDSGYIKYFSSYDTDTHKFIYDMKNKKVSVDNEIIDMSDCPFTEDFADVVFGARRFNTPLQLVNFEFEYFKIYDNDILVRDYRPHEANTVIDLCGGATPEIAGTPTYGTKTIADDYTQGTSLTNPQFKRVDGVYEDRFLLLENSVTGNDLTKINNYTGS
jgi:hypothetical protein